MTAVIVVLIIAIVLGAVIASAYNRLVKLRNKVQANWAQIDVVLKRRYDLIPNLVETVKGYSKHESETLENVVRARNAYASASSPEEKMQTSGQLTQALGHLFAVAESYPDLKANTNFMDLQKQLKETEDKIQFARQFYNDSAADYKNRCEMFPSNIIAGLFGFRPMPFFETDEESRKNPEVKF